MADLATHCYEMKVRNGEFSKEPCKPGEHDYSGHRLRGFPGHDYYVYYCQKCGRDKPDDDLLDPKFLKAMEKVDPL